jgi:hypothetical protein
VKVQAFEKDFPDVANAMAIVRVAEYKQLTGHILGEVQRFVGEQINSQIGPVAALVQNLAERTHVGDLQASVPNYDKLDVPKLAAWVRTQPAYLQGPYDTVMKTGTTAEVKDLIGRFHQATGMVQSAAAVRSPAEVAATATQKRAIAALAPVASARTGVAVAAAPTDFDGAFAAATREMAVQDGQDRFTR